MLGQYELAISMRDQAEHYIRVFASLAGYIGRISPPARVIVENEKAILKFTAIGKKWRHHIYVEFIPERRRNAGIFKVRPPYPMYLLAVMLPFASVSYPAIIIRVGDEIRGLMVPEYELAVQILSDALTKYSLLDPLDFTEDNGVSFEGYLHRTPIGFVSFFERKPHFPLVDIIESHLEEEEESDDIMHPADFFRKIVEGVIVKR